MYRYITPDGKYGFDVFRFYCGEFSRARLTLLNIYEPNIILARRLITLLPINAKHGALSFGA